MGSQNINVISDSKAKQEFTKYLLNDVKALETMLKEDRFEDDIQRIGAEQ